MEKIIELVQEINPYEDFNEKTDLFENEILDSLGLAELVINLESIYGIVIGEELITEENFKNVECIKNMIDKL